MDADALLDGLDAAIARLGQESPRTREDNLRAAPGIGVMVKDLRQWRGWNEHKLAKQTDVDMGTIIRLELGTQLPTLGRLKRIAAVLRRGEFVRDGLNAQRWADRGQRVEDAPRRALTGSINNDIAGIIQAARWPRSVRCCAPRRVVRTDGG